MSIETEINYFLESFNSKAVTRRDKSLNMSAIVGPVGYKSDIIINHLSLTDRLSK